ncbi:MAG: tRNA uridine-5-carboxymethylaminomethyl(34) synthesis enzyme MnmG [Oscillospiraceae bacterium]|nr:tRNA uridine-5-carboxymethylaminomethyl(34) synthesis enzyme MnmG [Oscillospiraceae bacterium]
MTVYDAGQFDIAVIGAGHAGIEAALAAARLGMKTVCFAVNLDSVGNMPCNPAIGGTGKGHLVRELDALGGEMGKAADAAGIQFRILNRGKGPAVHSLRAQADRRKYQELMKAVLENQPGLVLRQAEIVSVELTEGRVSSVTAATGARYGCRAAIVATGTYLGGRTIIGDVVRVSGPDGMAAALPLTDSLRSLGLRMRRFKTGTPPRVNALTVDTSVMELQPGDEDAEPFSFANADRPVENKAVCYLTYTNSVTHEIIRANLDRSPLFNGTIESTGPRYCPSIETKLVTLPDKERHQLFIEPMGLNTRELYIQGLSSSLPEDVQVQVVHSIAGLEHAQIQRSAYAIEYDCVDPTELLPTLESKKIPGLYGAGQFNGSSGYEEAAVQGLVAGVNAALKLKGKEPMILRRSDGYIGTLIDDLVTKGTEEPYRIMTSRSEYRLLHRQDNADERLSAIGYRVGLLSEERFAAVKARYAAVAAERKRLETTFLPPTEELNALLRSCGTAEVVSGVSLADLLRRPQISYQDLGSLDAERPTLPRAVWEEVSITLKYEGYISRQLRQVEEFRRMEDRTLPEDLDYDAVPGLRTEARQKLKTIRPGNFGQASRISGVSPADMAALMIWREKDKNRSNDKD